MKNMRVTSAVNGECQLAAHVHICSWYDGCVEEWPFHHGAHVCLEEEREMSVC